MHELLQWAPFASCLRLADAGASRTIHGIISETADGTGGGQVTFCPLGR